MARPLRYKLYGGAQEIAGRWQTRHSEKPRKFTANPIENGECRTLVPADPQKLAAYKKSLREQSSYPGR